DEVSSAVCLDRRGQIRRRRQRCRVRSAGKSGGAGRDRCAVRAATGGIGRAGSDSGSRRNSGDIDSLDRLRDTSMKTFRAVLLTIAFAAALAAQSVIHVDSREVVVDVTVTDGKGVPVQGLTKDDFSVTDEGKPRTITSFATASAFAPITGRPAPLHPAVEVHA